MLLYRYPFPIVSDFPDIPRRRLLAYHIRGILSHCYHAALSVSDNSISYVPYPPWDVRVAEVAFSA
jgi:hypothetical protein